MNTKILITAWTILTVTGAAWVWAGPDEVSPITRAISSVAAPEVPAKAVELIVAAKPESQESTTFEVVQAALRLRPTLATAVVSAIASKSPANAAAATAAAIGAQPKQARLITRAAVSAAPSKLREIVRAACKANPAAYYEIVMGASAAAPTSNKEILDALTEGLPEFKPRIDRVVAGYNGNPPSVAYVLDQARQTASVASSPAAARGPSIGAPFVPLSGTVTNAPPGGTVSTGARDYARP